MKISSEPVAFASADDLDAWLALNHGTAVELWVRHWKKTSGIHGVSREECIVRALAWGWIDGIGKSYDDHSLL